MRDAIISTIIVAAFLVGAIFMALPEGALWESDGARDTRLRAERYWHDFCLSDEGAAHTSCKELRAGTTFRQQQLARILAGQPIEP